MDNSYRGKNTKKNPIRRLHYNATSLEVVIDPKLVKTLGLDDQTYLEQKLVSDGILLQMKKLSPIQIPGNVKV
jgi:hypothetical protein